MRHFGWPVTFLVTGHVALCLAAGRPASKIETSDIWSLAVRGCINGLDALQFAAGQAAACNPFRRKDMFKDTAVLIEYLPKEW